MTFSLRLAVYLPPCHGFSLGLSVSRIQDNGIGDIQSFSFLHNVACSRSVFFDCSMSWLWNWTESETPFVSREFMSFEDELE